MLIHVSRRPSLSLSILLLALSLPYWSTFPLWQQLYVKAFVKL